MKKDVEIKRESVDLKMNIAFKNVKYNHFHLKYNYFID